MTPTAISQFIEAVCKVAVGVGFALWAKSKGYDDHIVATYTLLGVTLGVLLGMVFLYVRKALFKEERYLSYDTPISEKAKTTKTLLKQMLLIAVPITISSSVLSLTTILDTLMVQSRLISYGMNEVTVRIYYGDYTSLVISMFTLPTILLYPISNALVPLITSAHEKNDIKNEEKIRALSMRIISILAIPCAMGLGVFSHPILELLMFKAESVDRAAPWLSIASVSVLFLGIIAITNAFLNSYGHQKLPIISMIAGATVKLTSNYFLLGKIGILGAPISTVLCYFVAAAFNVFFVLKRVGKLPRLSRMLLYPFLCAFVAIGVAAGFYYFSSMIISSKASTVISIMIALVSYAFLILKARVIREEEISAMPGSDKLIKLLRKLKFLPKNSENV